jgi:hypothetical protein
MNRLQKSSTVPVRRSITNSSIGLPVRVDRTVRRGRGSIIHNGLATEGVAGVVKLQKFQLVGGRNEVSAGSSSSLVPAPQRHQCGGRALRGLNAVDGRVQRLMLLPLFMDPSFQLGDLREWLQGLHLLFNHVQAVQDHL